MGAIVFVKLFIYRLTHSASALSGFTCTSSLTMNEKFQYRTWGNDSGVLNLHHVYCTTIVTSRRLFHMVSRVTWYQVSHGTNQPIRKSEFVQCMKVE